MAKTKRSTQQETPIDYLTKSRAKFKTELSDRIKIGEGLHLQEVTSYDDLHALKESFYSWSSYNRELLKQSFNNPANSYYKEYTYSGIIIGSSVDNRPILSQLVKEEKNDINKYLTRLKRIYEKVDLLKTEYNDEIQFKEEEKIPTNSFTEVFIVHGHDELAKTETARFIEKLGLQAIILHEQASSGKTIIEKIENYTNVGFGIVLYTPCDVGSKKGEEDNLKSRARQNVVFEHGYLIGKIGRENVCALVKDNIEIPNDISGVVYVSMDEYKAWHYKIAKELKNSGYEIDMNKI
jgi:predicted nucleotide-binding protein